MSPERLVDERQVAAKDTVHFVRSSPGPVVVDEPVRRHDVGTHEVFSRVTTHAYDRAAGTAAAFGIVLRVLYQAMDSLFTFQRAVPGRVHTPQHRGELVRIRALQRFDRQLRHAHIMASEREATGLGQRAHA